MNELHILFNLFPEANWDYSALSYNKNININIAKKFKYETYYQANSSISLNDIIENKLNIDYNYISENPNLTHEFILKNHDKLNMYYLSRNKAVTMDFVKKNPHIKWNFYYLMLNPNITIDIIKSDYRFWGIYS